jgi:hypothetical protein
MEPTKRGESPIRRHRCPALRQGEEIRFGGTNDSNGRGHDLAHLFEAIQAHRSQGSEANRVIERFNRLKVQERQDIINFLRSL